MYCDKACVLCSPGMYICMLCSCWRGVLVAQGLQTRWQKTGTAVCHVWSVSWAVSTCVYLDLYYGGCRVGLCTRRYEVGSNGAGGVTTLPWQ